MSTREAEQIELQAATWILQRDRGELTPQDRAALESWLMADSRYRAAYLQLNEAWCSTAALKAWRPRDGSIDPDVLVRRIASAPPPMQKRRWVPAFAAALVLAVLGGVGWPVLKATRGEVFVTQVGGYQRVLLNDGSVLQLNTDSKVRVQLAQGQRQVRLLRGEVYFEVAHDPSRPFDVIAGDTVVRAVGTAFVVRLREAEQVDVLVTEGTVTVRTDGTAREYVESEERGLKAPAKPSEVSAGETAQAWRNEFIVARVDAVEIERHLAWQSGQLVFDKEPLAKVVAEFNRYNRRRIEIVDPALASLEVGGNFKATDLDSFLAAMRSALNVRTEETGESIRLLAP